MGRTITRKVPKRYLLYFIIESNKTISSSPSIFRNYTCTYPPVVVLHAHETHVTNTSLPAGEYVLSVSASGLGSLRAIDGDGEVAKRQHVGPSKAKTCGNCVEKRGGELQQSDQQLWNDQRSYLGAEFPRVDATHPRSHACGSSKARVRRPGREQRQRRTNGASYLQADRGAGGETVRDTPPVI